MLAAALAGTGAHSVAHLGDDAVRVRPSAVATSAPHAYDGELHDDRPRPVAVASTAPNGRPTQVLVTPVPDPAQQQGSFVAQLGTGPYALDQFRGLPAPRSPVHARGTDVLFVLSDVRAAPTPTPTSSFSIVLAHLDDGGHRLDLVEIPTTLYAMVPGYGYNRIGSAWVQGGTGLLRAGVEALTGIGVDSVVVLDMTRSESLVDAVDGITVDVTDPSPLFPQPGAVRVTGQRALWFTREPKTLAGGPVDNEMRRVRALQGMLARYASPYELSSPAVRRAIRTGVLGAVVLEPDVSRYDVGAAALALLRLDRSQIVVRSVAVRWDVVDAYAGPVRVGDPSGVAALRDALRTDAMAGLA